MSAKPGLPCIAASPAPDLGPPSGRQQDKVTGREGTGLEIEAWGPGGERKGSEEGPGPSFLQEQSVSDSVETETVKRRLGRGLQGRKQ